MSQVIDLERHLSGAHVRLEPLHPDHLDALCAVGLDPDLWRWIPIQVHTRDDMAAYILAALAGRDRGDMVPFVIIDPQTRQVVGSTRYMNMDLANRRVEIGSTWVAGPWQRTAVNTEAKLLLLRHAFEELGCVRVELKTDALNERSRRAILRLGAKEEGTLRKHMVTASGRIRDTVYFSILDTEWEAVRAGLEAKLTPP
ncbi:MAG: GNAT family protein [Rhodothermales bacterium]|nr:GNAT family protein [Rhodothermales bacterium]